MSPQIVSVELDDETARRLAALGKPADVLAGLARSIAGEPEEVDHHQRAQTDESLRFERDATDSELAEKQSAADREADEVVRTARLRADHVMQTARETSDRALGRTSTFSDASTGRARALLEHERADADAILERERDEGSQRPRAFLEAERESTDKDLDDERGHADTLLVDQREANARMVSATIEAHELRDAADIAQRRSEQSEAELRAVAEFRERFIAILGHDLRNPLGSISMSAGLLIRGGRLSAQDADIAARIARSGQRMTRMISQLLDLTRTRLGGGFPIDAKQIDLRDICRNVIEELPAAIALDVTGDVTGQWDPDRLAEVLSNVAGNAIEYSAPGTAVRIHARADGVDAVVVEVTNHGDPIAADVLPFIFEPFRRAHQGAKSAAGNLGLGLYIAHQIVLAHGGTLQAHSATGMTTFVMRLPRQARLNDDAAIASSRR